MTSVGIIGFGRFGKVLYNILQKGYAVKVYDPAYVLNKENTGYLDQEFLEINIVNWETIIQEKTIFVAVPISHFEKVIQKMASHLRGDQIVIDVCSVKVHPSQVMERYLPKETGIIATHPLFGPDSYPMSRRAKIMMFSQRNNSADKKGRGYQGWKDFFHKQGLEIVEMTPEEHDRLAAETQGLTHYLGRFLKEFGIRKTPIDTQGFIDLLHLVDQTCNDTWELYLDLQRFNPFTKEMIQKVDRSIKELNQRAKLL